VVLACNDWELAAAGLRVAPTPDGAKLFTSSERRAFELIGDGEDGETRELPAAFHRTIVALAQQQDGEVVLGAHAGSLTIFRHDGAQWQLQGAADAPREFIRWYDFEIGPEGAAHFWIETNAAPSFEHVTRTAENEWETEVVMPGHPGSYTRWTLTRSGVPASLSVANDGASLQLEAIIAGDSAPLGDPSDFAQVTSYRPLSPAVPQAAAGAPELAAALERAEGLSVAWSSGDDGEGYVEVDVPGTMPATFGSCGNLQPSGQCDVDCEDQSSGVNEYAITQTSDGMLWLAWVSVQRDVFYDYSEAVEPCMFECFCATTIVDRGTTAALQLARIDPTTGEVHKLLSMPTLPIQDSNAFILAQPDARLLDVRAFGDRLAIGMRTRVAEPGDDEWLSELRLIEVDTSAL
jgi:hypothetical protein